MQDQEIFDIELRSVEKFKDMDLQGAMDDLQMVIDAEDERIRELELTIKMTEGSIKKRKLHIKDVLEKITAGKDFLEKYPSGFSQN